MSMIGLLTGAPQATGGKAKTDDAAAAGFGSTLQGAMDALAEAGKNHPGEADATTADLSSLVETAASYSLPASRSSATGTALPALSIPLAPLVETATGNPVAASMPTLLVEPGATPPVPNDAPASVGRAVGSETATGNSSPASTSSATGMGSASGTSVPASALPLVELVETATGGPLPASTGSASGSGLATVNAPAAPSTQPASLVETAKSTAVPVSPPAARLADSGASFGTGVVAPGSASGSLVPVSTIPLVELVETPTGNSLPASLRTARPTDAGASFGTGVVAPSSANGNASASSSTVTVSTAATTNASPVAAPVSAPVQSVSPAATVVAPAPTASVPFATQLARPIFSLAAAGAGEHIMTVSVTPDNLGPVTVRAHVGADGVRVELFAPNDLGRDAIRAIIPDLRRDLAGAGLGGNLTLSSQNQPSADGSAHGSNAGQPGERDAERGNSTRGESVAAENPDTTREQAVDRTGLFGTTSTIDVLV